VKSGACARISPPQQRALYDDDEQGTRFITNPGDIDTTGPYGRLQPSHIPSVAGTITSGPSKFIFGKACSESFTLQEMASPLLGEGSRSAPTTTTKKDNS
jgi:hypothetical protein